MESKSAAEIPAETPGNGHAGKASPDELDQDEGTSPAGIETPGTGTAVEEVDEDIEDCAIVADNNNKSQNQGIISREMEAGLDDL